MDRVAKQKKEQTDKVPLFEEKQSHHVFQKTLSLTERKTGVFWYKLWIVPFKCEAECFLINTEFYVGQKTSMYIALKK